MSSSSRSSRAMFLWLSVLSLLSLGTAYKELSDSFLRAIPSPGYDIDPRNGSLLAPLLIPRVPGTPGQTVAQQHLFNFFRSELPKWDISWQNSTSTTPVSGHIQIPFANLIVKREPPWVKPGQANLLTLVAHYDSKYMPKGFVGATDSAAPCAMLMHVAKVVDTYVSQMYDEMAELGEGGSVEMDMGVQILFLDGEEAFEKWSDTDSLYGSRALAQQWATERNPASEKFYKYRTPLSQISLFLLLDLLGAPNPMVPSYFPTTHWAYVSLSKVESRMRSLHLLETSPSDPFLPDHNMTMARGQISDDHLPFIARGVETLHIIPSPFPHVWHSLEDNAENLDMETVRDWSKIVSAFVLEWLDMMEVWYGDEESAIP
ncbi:hypothetical protein BU26DRAFT_491303 [Trematosphaeria pertusa]|uniref:Peptide hydrolase n=1 Tax=Trematosphaeria pertusa TaxID=390896 RepID=A0A6A6I244_9PLEO|nr:uncharacterized protein BU26DRAFT_491303 [Trematosphaeria pertusa]KAF2244042.1 hypothetical protein BU26DRAFT_491303 [Trematosphaeria pertusa]